MTTDSACVVTDTRTQMHPMNKKNLFTRKRIYKKHYQIHLLQSSNNSIWTKLPHILISMNKNLFIRRRKNKKQTKFLYLIIIHTFSIREYIGSPSVVRKYTKPIKKAVQCKTSGMI